MPTQAGPQLPKRWMLPAGAACGETEGAAGGDWRKGLEDLGLRERRRPSGPLNTGVSVARLGPGRGKGGRGDAHEGPTWSASSLSLGFAKPVVGIFTLSIVEDHSGGMRRFGNGFSGALTGL